MDKLANEEMLGVRAFASSPLGNNSVEATAPGHAPEVETTTVDPYTLLLLHMDGANNGTTFTDEMGNTITRVPFPVNAVEAFLTTGQKKFGATSVRLIDDSTITWPAFSTTGDFTVDFWIRLDGTESVWYIFSTGNTSLVLTASLKLNLLLPSVTIAGSAVISSTSFTHVAVVRSGSTVTFYVNGVSQGSSTFTGDLTTGGVPTHYLGQYGKYEMPS